ncbi:hypothetical protein [Jannaschia marina]|uniref:hypothetical protein n=1 Tax=Jannaschia marina TaxID=2741674 RepID=UPI0015CB1801|nr:hypothetical protein [Jannaschia marina]
MRVAMVFVLLFSGCSLFRPPEPVVLPFVPGCADYVALARAVVDGRRAGQSRQEQRLQVDEAAPHAAVHRATVESVYDWPRPTTARDWRALRETTAAAAEVRCVNRPARTLRGGWPP